MAGWGSSPNLYGNHRTEWWVFQQPMFDCQRLHQKPIDGGNHGKVMKKTQFMVGEKDLVGGLEHECYFPI